MRVTQGPRDSRRVRAHRVRAVLASGVVLGVGGAVTLAAWNDSEHATASFAAGVFGIEGSTDGSNFSEHTSSNPAELGFSVNFDALYPGAAVYALFSVRTIEDSVGGSVQLVADEDNNEDLGEWLTYSVRTVSAPTCNVDAFAAGQETGLPQEAPLSADADESQDLAAGGSDPVNYCFKVMLPLNAPNGAQGKTVDARWTLRASSS